MRNFVVSTKPAVGLARNSLAWWRHDMETFSALLAICAGNSPVTGEFPTQRPVTRSFDVFFDLSLNKRLSKQSWGWWFEVPSRSLWRHPNGVTDISEVLIIVGDIWYSNDCFIQSVQRQIQSVEILSLTNEAFSHCCHPIRHLNNLKPRQNGRHFAVGVCKSIFLNENCCILIQIILKFVPNVSINTRLPLCPDYYLVPSRRKAIIWTNGGLLYWCIDASLGLN